MKSRFTVLLVSLLTTFLFTQCSKDSDKVFNANFYTAKTNGKHFLYIDDAYVGVLPYFSVKPDCNTGYSDGPKPLVFQLASGGYRIVGKDEQGRITSESIMYISGRKMSVSGSNGGLNLSNNGSCLAVGLSE